MLGSALRAGKEGRASLLLRQLDEVALVPRCTDGTTWLRKVALGTTGPSPEAPLPALRAVERHAAGSPAPCFWPTRTQAYRGPPSAVTSEPTRPRVTAAAVLQSSMASPGEDVPPPPPDHSSPERHLPRAFSWPSPKSSGSHSRPVLGRVLLKPWVRIVHRAAFRFAAGVRSEAPRQSLAAGLTPPPDTQHTLFRSIRAAVRKASLMVLLRLPVTLNPQRSWPHPAFWPAPLPPPTPHHHPCPRHPSTSSARTTPLH